MWRKTTGAKPSPQASHAQDSAQARTKTPTETTEETSSSETSFAAAAVELEKRMALANGQVSVAEPEVSDARPVGIDGVLASAPALPPMRAVTSEGASRVSSGIKIRGEISGNTDLYIDGEVQGELRFGQAKVTVGPSGRVHANIEAREIFVQGKVQGTLRAGESVRLGGASRVQGNLHAPRIAIEEGAHLSGKVDMTGSADSRGALPADELPKASALGAAV
jgi:cytoskeletal protein CcmA (bactofilin family)